MNSSVFLGDIKILNAKFGVKEAKLYLGDAIVYPTTVPITDAVVTCDDVIYNGNNQVATNIVVTLSGVTLTQDVDYVVTSNTGGTNAGSYTVSVSGINSYDETASCMFTINKVTPTVTPPTAKELTYNSSPQALVELGSTNFGTLKYSLDGSTYSTSVPSGTNAISYTVYYKVDGDSNINDVPAESINVTIAKADPSYTAPTAKSLTYNTSSQALINAGSTNYGTLMYRDTRSSPESYWDNFEWTTTVPTSTNSSYNEPHQIQYKVVGDSNVNDVAMVKLGSTSIARADSTISATIPSTVEVGITASITNVSSTGDGSITYSSSDTSKATVSSSGVITGKAAGTVTITVTMGTSNNYNSSSTSKTVTIKVGTTKVKAIFMGPPFDSIVGIIDLKNFAYYSASDGNAYVGFQITSSGQDVTSDFKRLNGGKPLIDLKDYCVNNSISSPTLITNMFTGRPTYSGSYSITMSRNGQIAYDKNTDTITLYFMTGQ